MSFEAALASASSSASASAALPSCVSLEGIPVSEHWLSLPVSQIRVCVRIINSSVPRSALHAAAALVAAHPDRPVAAAFASTPLPAHRAQDTALIAFHGWLDNAASWDATAPTCITEYAKSDMGHRLTEMAARDSASASSTAAASSSARSQLVIYAFEMAGHGDSDHRSSTSTYHPVEHSLDMMQAVDSLCLPAGAPCFLVGHSMGGAVATMVAQMMGRRCQGLVLMDSIGPMISSAPAMPAPIAAEGPPLPDAAMLKLSASLSDTCLHGNGLLAARAPKLYPSLAAITDKYINGNPFMDERSARVLARRAVRRVHVGPASAEDVPAPSSSGWIFKHDPRLISTHLVQPTECTALRGFAALDAPVVLYLADNYRRRAIYGAGQRDPRVPTHWVLAETNPQYPELLLARLRQVQRGAQVRIVRGDHHLHMDEASATNIARDLVRWINQVDANTIEPPASNASLQSKL